MFECEMRISVLMVVDIYVLGTLLFIGRIC